MASESRIRQASPPGRAATPTTPEASRLLTVAEIARYLHLHEKTIYAMVARRELPSIRLGRRVRFLPDDILRWVSARKEG
jgi:excisionase family DNA binding protein